MASQYKCIYSVNGAKTEEIIIANGPIDARKIIEARYSGAKITWWSCNQVIR